MLVLVICCFSLFIVGLDSTIVNVALPSIGRELHASVAGLQWTIDGYTLVLASLLMLSGATADRVGRRRTFQVGLAVFTVGSGLCSLAPGLGWLVGFRMVQAVGGSMLNPVAMSIITNTFTDRAERGRSGPGAVRSPCRWRSARSWAASWSSPSAGAACSGSTSRSAWPRSRWPPGSFPNPGRPGPAGQTRPDRGS